MDGVCVCRAVEKSPEQHLFCIILFLHCLDLGGAKSVRVRLSLLNLLLLIHLGRPKCKTRDETKHWNEEGKRIAHTHTTLTQHAELNILFYIYMHTFGMNGSQWSNRSLLSLATWIFHFVGILYISYSRARNERVSFGAHCLRIWRVSELPFFHCYLTFKLPLPSFIYSRQYLQCIWDLLCFNYWYIIRAW